jgi:hypothetical protein
MKRFFISLCTTLLLLAMVEPVAAENITFAAPNVKALSVTNLSTDQ